MDITMDNQQETKKITYLIKLKYKNKKIKIRKIFKQLMVTKMLF